MKIKKFEDFIINESVKLGDFVNDYKLIIIDIFDPEEGIKIDLDTHSEKYIEYIAYGVDDKCFYLLDPDFEIIEGPHRKIEDLYEIIGVEEIPDYEKYIK